MIQRPARTQPHLQEPPPPSGASSAAAPDGSSGGRGLAYQTPVVTFALIAVNVAMWVVTTALAPRSWLYPADEAGGVALVLLGGKLGPAIQTGEWWRLVTAMFLHAGLVHLTVNMWALLQLGTLCEILYGRARFLILYVCAGVLGNVASYEASPGLGVGASGAIFGLFGVAIVFGLKYRRELPGQMGDRLLRSLVPVLLINLALTFSFSMIDKFAHLGGLVAGALLAALTESRTASAARHAREWLPVPAALASVVGLLLYGVWGLASVYTTSVPLVLASLAAQRNETRKAIRLLEPLVRRNPGNVDADELLAELLIKSGQGVRAEAVYRRALSRNPNDPRLLNGLAYLYADHLGTHLDEAERLAQRAVAVQPKEGMFVDTLAWVYYKEGKLEEAYATQQQAVQLSANQADLRYHMGAIEEAMGHIPAAREEYEMALRLNPKLPEAQQALARLKSRAPPPALSKPPRQSGSPMSAS
jgi:membrane associated rhomboid family serine protease/Flp pilus assembly protein TadD